MSADALVPAAQLSWLTLCGMMLVSRFVFRREGPEGMRRFLDAWKTSRTHRVWGLLAAAWGLVLGAGLVRDVGELGFGDLVVVASVVVVLCADGLLNLVPAGFSNFKERMQDAWVRRHEGTERTSDAHLFGTVNLALGVASLAVGVAVYAHRPPPMIHLAGVLALATVLTFALIQACRREGRSGSAPRPVDSPDEPARR